MPIALNPVISGCHPDPSICRVGEDYFLVTSSFGYFPGIPIFHSRDLATWTQIGHVLNRATQLDLRGFDISDGIWAPTIRHHNGVFYVVSTIARNRQGHTNFIVTATNPAGPWSDPVDLNVEGIDPSLFFDTEGKCWFIGCRDALHPVADGPGELWMREMDLGTLTLVGQTHILWHGAVTGAWVEAPHIYQRGDTFHLIAAEGGTADNHAVTSATATSLTGPYSTDPRSPLLTHRHLSATTEFQNIGHADVIDDVQGNWWAVVLGVRRIDGAHTLGREVFLVPMEWQDAGPVFAPDSGVVESVLVVPDLDVTPPAIKSKTSDDFRSSSLGHEWVGLRGDPLQNAEIGRPQGGVHLRLQPQTLSESAVPAYLGRRQQHVSFTATTMLSFEPEAVGEVAGLTLFHNETNYLTLTLEGGHDNCPRASLTIVQKGVSTLSAVRAVDGWTQLLTISGDRDSYRFSIELADGTQEELGGIDRRQLSSEQLGTFVGVQIGMFATSTGQPSEKSALFHWFTYEGVAADNRTTLPATLTAAPLQLTSAPKRVM